MITRPLGQWIALTALRAVSIVWALGTVSGDWLVPTVVVVVVLANPTWARWGPPARRSESTMVAAALRTHADPGAAHRATVDREARVLLAAPSWSPWFGGACVAALVAVCLVSAVRHHDPATLVPGALVLVTGVVVTALARFDAGSAAWWLAEPPYPAAAASEVDG